MSEYQHNLENFQNPLLGASILGEAFRDEPVMFAELLFVNRSSLQESVAGFIFFRNEDGKKVQTPEDVAKAWEYFADLQVRLRLMFTNALAEDSRREQLKMQREHDQAHRQLLQKLKESQKPHDMGTVAEIAARYRISKSEVRRLKAANELHTLTQSRL